MQIKFRWLILGLALLGMGSVIAQNGGYYPPQSYYQQPSSFPQQGQMAVSDQYAKIESQLNQTKERLDTLETRFASKEELDKIKTEIGGLSKQVHALQQNSSATQVQQMQDRLQQLESVQNILFVVVGGIGVLVLFLFFKPALQMKPQENAPTVKRPALSAGQSRTLREFTGLLRPDLPEEISVDTQEQWVEHARNKGAWQAEWEIIVKQGLQKVLDSGRPNAESQIALFLMDYWCPLLACYETDAKNWNWFKEKFLASCPTQWQASIHTPSVTGKFVSEVIAETDRILGKGETIKEVVRPEIIVQNASQAVIAQRKAWVMT